MPNASFREQNDTPYSYATHALKYVRVNAGETGLEFQTFPAIPVLPTTQSVYIEAMNWYTPSQDTAGYQATFRHYVRTGGSLNYSYNSWELSGDTDDPLIQTTFALPESADLAVPLKVTPYFTVSAVATGTGVRMKAGAKFTANGTVITTGPTMDQQDTVIAPAVETLYYGTEHSFTPSDAAARFLQLRIRRIYGGGDAGPDQYTGLVYFLGARLTWGLA